MPDKKASGIGVSPLPADLLRRRIALEWPDMPAEQPLDAAGAILGQQRAEAAINFGIGVKKAGFNIFALGPAGLGKHRLIRQLISSRAKDEAVPQDWIYVNNFDDPQKPSALALPPGRAAGLADGMAKLIDDLTAALPALLTSEDTRARISAIAEEIDNEREKAFEAIKQEAKGEHVAIVRTPMGFAMAPLDDDGKVVKPETFNEWEEEKRREVQDRIERLQTRLEEFFRAIPGSESEKRRRIRALNEDLAKSAVDASVDELEQRFADLENATAFLHIVREDLIRNFALFLQDSSPESGIVIEGADSEDVFGRYQVNVLVSNHRDDDSAGPAGAPVIYEDHPTLGNLVGRIEHISHMGTLATNFTLIRPGALHRANGGYLLIDAQKLLAQPFAWEALKRTLRGGRIAIETPAEYLSLVATRSLEPDPIPLDIRIVLIGERWLFYLLNQLDSDFPALFKVQADFDDQADVSPGNIEKFGALLTNLGREEQLLPLRQSGVAAMIEQAIRQSADREKLSLVIDDIADLLTEADYAARSAGARAIEAAHVETAIAAGRRRASRIEERGREAMLRDIMLVQTEGAAVGQVNGLSVIDLGSFAFGRPSRITARVRMGTGKLIDIEREVQLGGPLHSKGVLILSGYLAGRYAQGRPMSLWASLVFEQSYGGVDGDSASSAELYALLSALAGAPLQQGLAVTGSVNQNGRVQAIGGVNEKIEGFFDLCRARGLNGAQGVLIPEANTAHLMLRKDVVEAAEQGLFRVIPISTIDEGMEVLTGIEAGQRNDEGAFPPQSINGRVEHRLNEFARARRLFAAEPKPENGPEMA